MDVSELSPHARADRAMFDPVLSLGAKATMWLATYQPDGVEESTSEALDTIRRYFDELVEHGYLVRDVSGEYAHDPFVRPTAPWTAFLYRGQLYAFATRAMHCIAATRQGYRCSGVVAWADEVAATGESVMHRDRLCEVMPVKVNRNCSLERQRCAMHQDEERFPDKAVEAAFEPVTGIASA